MTEKKRRAPGGGRKPAHEAPKVRHTVTLSPVAWAIVAAYRARHQHRSVSETLEAIVRQEQTMSSTTELTVKAIRVRTNLDHLFEGSDYDPALCNEAATREQYKDELQEELHARYPEADITIWDNTVARTEVSTDTDHDNSRDEDTRFAVLTLAQEVQDAVDDSGVTVYARGTFWIDQPAAGDGGPLDPDAE